VPRRKNAIEEEQAEFSGSFSCRLSTWQLQSRPLLLIPSNYFSGLRYKVLDYTTSGGMITDVGERWRNSLLVIVLIAWQLSNMAPPHLSPKRRAVTTSPRQRRNKATGGFLLHQDPKRAIISP
jgi:hypothetical protein